MRKAKENNDISSLLSIINAGYDQKWLTEDQHKEIMASINLKSDFNRQRVITITSEAQGLKKLISNILEYTNIGNTNCLPDIQALSEVALTLEWPVGEELNKAIS